jgi:hypothetical protein
MPAEGFVLSDENIGVPASREVYKPQVGIVPVEVGQSLEGDEILPPGDLAWMRACFELRA